MGTHLLPRAKLMVARGNLACLPTSQFAIPKHTLLLLLCYTFWRLCVHRHNSSADMRKLIVLSDQMG